MKLDWWVKYILGLSVLMVALTFFSYYKTTLNHYIGKAVVTPEQYTEIMSNGIEKGLGNQYKYNIVTINEEGIVTFEYDFYSGESYDYLTSKERSILDMPLIYSIKRLFASGGGSFWVVLLVGIVWVVFYYYLTVKKGKLFKLLAKIKHWLERESDKRIEEVKNAIVTTDVSYIKPQGNGIVGVRSWKVDKKGTLVSIYTGTKWDGKELKSDKKPDKDGVKGVYAYRLGANLHMTATVLGIVELDGNYEYHAEGVVRAEHCKIIGFFMSKGLERTARFISNKYSVPVLLANDSEIAYMDWLYSEQGQKALQHNYELLKEK